MGNEDSDSDYYATLFPDDFHPYPFMLEDHPISSVINQHHQDPNLILQLQQQQQHYHSGYFWIHDTVAVEEIDYSMGGGLCLLENPYNETENRPSPWTTEQLVISLAKDPLGCRCLQEQISKGNPDEVKMILSEVTKHLHELMMHPYGNYLIQKIFQTRSSVVTSGLIDSIVLLIISDEPKLRDVCRDDHGTRAIQRMLNNIQYPSTMVLVACTMKSIAFALMIDVNGSYVIVQCLKLFPPTCQNVILEEIARNCVVIATDKVGCSVIQKCLSHANGSGICQLVIEIISNALFLAEDSYGNYVMQFLIKWEIPIINEEMIEVLRGTYARLSMNKHGSNVVENLLRYSRLNAADVIVQEIMESDDFLDVIQDPFGNYVAQRALEYTKGRLHRKLSDKIKSNYRSLHNHLYGKRVLRMACTERRYVSLCV